MREKAGLALAAGRLSVIRTERDAASRAGFVPGFVPGFVK